MRIQYTRPSRKFRVGFKDKVELTEVAKISLESDELITFTGAGGVEYDITRKEWGFYATPSLNSRLPEFHLRPALVKNSRGQWFMLLVEEGHEAEFETYCRNQELLRAAWLDDEKTLESLERALCKRKE